MQTVTHKYILQAIFLKPLKVMQQFKQLTINCFAHSFTRDWPHYKDAIKSAQATGNVCLWNYITRHIQDYPQYCWNEEYHQMKAVSNSFPRKQTTTE